MCVTATAQSRSITVPRDSGRVHLARLQDGYSTTGICRKLSGKGAGAG